MLDLVIYIEKKSHLNEIILKTSPFHIYQWLQ